MKLGVVIVVICCSFQLPFASSKRTSNATIDAILMGAMKNAERKYGGGRKTDKTGIVVDRDGLIIPPGNPKIRLAELDIAIPEDTTGRFKRAAYRSAYWPGGVVPFEIASQIISAGDEQLVLDGIEEWKAYTCLEFVPHTTEANWIYFQEQGSGCWSYLGFIGGRQEINLGPGCMWIDIITHEIGHALGLGHEQNRPDRDGFVEIMWRNIYRNWHSQFQKAGDNVIDSRSVPYDYRSVMHYGQYDAARRGIAIRTLDPAYQNVIGTAPTVSFRDVAVVSMMYQCASTCGVPYEYVAPPNTEYYVDGDCNQRCPADDGENIIFCSVPPPASTTPPATPTPPCQEDTSWCQSRADRCHRPNVQSRCPCTCGA